METNETETQYNKNAEKIINEYSEECAGLTPEKLRRKVRQFYIMNVRADHHPYGDKEEYMDSKLGEAYEVLRRAIYEKNTNIPKEQLSNALKTMRKSFDGRGAPSRFFHVGPLECGEVENVWRKDCRHHEVMHQASELQRPIELDGSAETEQKINQIKNLEKELVSNAEYPLSGHATKEQTVGTDNSSTNKLAAVRKKLAHDIDETFGTHLEEKKLAKPLKKIEKAVSDKLFGKVKD